MKKIYTMALAVLGIAAVSCQKNTVAGSGDNGKNPVSKILPNEMIFVPNTASSNATKGITPDGYASKVDSTIFETLGTIYVAACRKAAGTSAEEYVENFTNTSFCSVDLETVSEEDKEAAKTWYHGDPTPKFWPEKEVFEADPYHFYASNVSLTSGTAGKAPAVTVSTGKLTDAESVKDAVCMYCPTPEWAKANKVTMEHIFSRITKVVVGSPFKDKTQQVVSDLRIEILPDTCGTFDLFKGLDPARAYLSKTDAEKKLDPDNAGWVEVTHAADSVNIVKSFDAIAASIESAVRDSTMNDLYLIPGTYRLHAHYTLTRGDNVQTLDKYNTVVIRRGCRNIIRTTLPGSEIEEIIFEVKVKPWEDNNIILDEDSWENEE